VLKGAGDLLAPQGEALGVLVEIGTAAPRRSDETLVSGRSRADA